MSLQSYMGTRLPPKNTNRRVSLAPPVEGGKPEQSSSKPFSSPESLMENLWLGQALSGLSPVFMRLGAMPSKTQRLFIGDQTVESFLQLIKKDFQERAQQLIETSFPMAEGCNPVIVKNKREAAYPHTIQALGHVYREAVLGEFQAMSKSLPSLDAVGKEKFYELMDQHPEGVLTANAIAMVQQVISVLFGREDEAPAPGV